MRRFQLLAIVCLLGYSCTAPPAQGPIITVDADTVLVRYEDQELHWVNNYAEKYLPLAYAIDTLTKSMYILDPPGRFVRATLNPLRIDGSKDFYVDKSEPPCRLALLRGVILYSSNRRLVAFNKDLSVNYSFTDTIMSVQPMCNRRLNSCSYEDQGSALVLTVVSAPPDSSQREDRFTFKYDGDRFQLMGVTNRCFILPLDSLR